MRVIVLKTVLEIFLPGVGQLSLHLFRRHKKRDGSRMEKIDQKIYVYNYFLDQKTSSIAHSYIRNLPILPVVLSRVQSLTTCRGWWTATSGSATFPDPVVFVFLLTTI